MPTLTWSHRPAYPDIPDSHDAHRTVLVDGQDVGSARLDTTSPHKGWYWNGYWHRPESGLAETLEEALGAIRTGYLERLAEAPEDIEYMHKLRRESAARAAAWYAKHGPKPEPRRGSR